MDLTHSGLHNSWQSSIRASLQTVDPTYLNCLESNQTWLPGPLKIFNAFSIPMQDTRYILFGESPYPRADSANGYAFWDAAVHDVWSANGLSKPVNRATSLRNFIKMLLIADQALTPDDCSQPAIARLDKTPYIKTCDELFLNLLSRGFLLLNASLVLSERAVAQDAKAWRPFMETLLTHLYQEIPSVQLILFGKIAEAILRLPPAQQFKNLTVEHPYNISFITNPKVINFFQPMQLLKTESHHV